MDPSTGNPQAVIPSPIPIDPIHWQCMLERVHMTWNKKELRLILALFLSTLGASCAGSEGGDPEGAHDIAATLALDVAYPEPFSYLTGVRELGDGRLLAADPLSQVLLRVDMNSGTADTLGGVGGGPQEYQQPDRVFPLPGDSTLLVDLGKTYLTVLGPDGTHHGGSSMALPGEEGRMSIILPSAVDDAGRIYFGGSGVNIQGPPDSTSILRHDRSTGVTETVARAWRTEATMTRSGNNVAMSLPRMMPNDDWAVGADGRVAVVRANGYRVEWYMPDGQVVTGPDTPFEALAIGQSDKEADLEAPRSGGLMISMSMGSSGEQSMKMRRGGGFGSGNAPRVEDSEWGETFPPFRKDRSVVSARNEVWVQRWLPGDRTPAMDVFDSLGVQQGKVEIPARSVLIGFGRTPDGAEVAYFTRSDELDLQWLERYRVVRK
jgi:hypothetical protein